MMDTFKEIILTIKYVLYFTWFFFIFCVTHLEWAIRNFVSTKSDSLACLVGKTAIITGGNSGIGYGTALLLASRGCKVIIACRSDARKEVESIKQRTGNLEIISIRLDLCSLKSVRMFAEDIKKREPKIDILVNNAGALATSKTVSDDGLNALMQTNYFGSFLLTHLLVESLKASASARVVFLSSAFAYTHRLSLEYLNKKDFAEDERTSFVLYSNSKVCNILAAQEFANRLRKHQILVYSADPGTSRTKIFQGIDFEGDAYWKIFLRLLSSPLMKNPIDAAQTTFHLATSEKLNNESGQLYFRCKRWQKPKILKDQKFVEMIWEETERLVQLKPKEKLLCS